MTFFLEMIATFVIVIGLLYWEVKLSAKRRAWQGLIPIAVLVIAALSVNFLVYEKYGKNDIEELRTELNNGMTARMYVRAAGDEIRFYSPIEIIDEEGVLRDSVAVVRIRGMEGGPTTYHGLFEKMTKGKEVISTYAVDKEVIQDKNRYMINHGGGYISFDIATQIYLPVLYMGLPLLGIYIFRRRQVRKAQIAEELRRMAIENL